MFLVHKRPFIIRNGRSKGINPDYDEEGDKEDDFAQSFGENDELSKMQNSKPLTAKKDHRRIMPHLLRQSFSENMEKLLRANVNKKRDHRRIISHLLRQSVPENMDNLPSANVNEVTKRLGKGGWLNLDFNKRILGRLGKRLGKGAWLDKYLLYHLPFPRLKKHSNNGDDERYNDAKYYNEETHHPRENLELLKRFDEVNGNGFSGDTFSSKVNK